jgi:hypothetical protein
VGGAKSCIGAQAITSRAVPFATDSLNRLMRLAGARANVHAALSAYPA